MPHAQPVLHSRVAAVRGSRIKIATDVADMLRSSEAKARTGRSFSLAVVGDLTAVGVRPGPAESATGSMEKMLDCCEVQVRHHTAERPGWILLSDIRRAISSSHSRRDVRLTHNTCGRDLNVTSLQSGAGTHPLSTVLETT